MERKNRLKWCDLVDPYNNEIIDDFDTIIENAKEIDRKIITHILKHISFSKRKVEHMKNIYECIKCICKKNSLCVDNVDDKGQNVLFHVIKLYHPEIVASTIELFKTYSSDFNKLLNQVDYMGELCFMKADAFIHFKEYDINIDHMMTKGYVSCMFSNIFTIDRVSAYAYNVNKIANTIELDQDKYTYREFINILHEFIVEQKDKKNMFYRIAMYETKHSADELNYIKQYIDENMTSRAKSAYKR